jgi:hypothetical protein
MTTLLKRFGIWLVVTIVTFAVYNASVYLDATMTQKTPFYFAFHFWVSVILCPIIGVCIALSEDL